MTATRIERNVKYFHPGWWRKCLCFHRHAHYS